MERFQSMLCVLCVLFFLFNLQTHLVFSQNIVAPSASPTALIEVLQPAAFAGKSRTYINALTGSSMVLECQIYNKPLTSIVQWQMKHVSVLSNGTEVEQTAVTIISKDYNSMDMSKWRIGQGRQTNSYRLEIESMTFDSDGRYYCRVDYSPDTAPLMPALRVYVYQPPAILPSWTTASLTRKTGDEVNLQCNASGYPLPYITWARVGGSSALIPGWGMGYEGTNLTLSSISPDARGVYVCNALNLVGSDRWSLELIVIFDPIVKAQNTSLSQAVGYNKQLLCTISGNPVPTVSQVKWLKDGQLVTNSRRTRIDYNQGADYTVYLTLNLQPVQSGDFGTYTCSAQTTGNSVSASIVLSQSSSPTDGRTGLIQAASGLAFAPLSGLVALLVALLFIRLARTP